MCGKSFSFGCLLWHCPVLHSFLHAIKETSLQTALLVCHQEKLAGTQDLAPARADDHASTLSRRHVSLQQVWQRSTDAGSEPPTLTADCSKGSILPMERTQAPPPQASCSCSWPLEGNTPLLGISYTATWGHRSMPRHATWDHAGGQAATCKLKQEWAGGLSKHKTPAGANSLHHSSVTRRCKASAYNR